MKILNLYSGIGGNRKLWGGEHQITAVENNEEIAQIYRDYFPNDKLVIEDAHQYLLEHYKEFEFIWSSPPCPTHSNTNNFLNAQGVIRYPDMRLYQEVIFLKHFHKGKWVVENVIPYYVPLIPGSILGRHYFWSNFSIIGSQKKNTISITNARESTRRTKEQHLKDLQKFHGFETTNIKALSNCVEPKTGLHVFNCAFKTKQLKICEEV